MSWLRLTNGWINMDGVTRVHERAPHNLEVLTGHERFASFDGDDAMILRWWLERESERHPTLSPPPPTAMKTGRGPTGPDPDEIVTYVTECPRCGRYHTETGLIGSGMLLPATCKCGQWLPAQDWQKLDGETFP